MKKMWNVGLLAVVASAVLGLTAASARAEGVNPQWVPADAKFVGHVDVDAMRGSKLVAKAWNELMKRQPNAKMELDKAAETLGMDVRNDLHGVTVYSKTLGDQKGVMIVCATLNPEKLEALAEKAENHDVSEYGEHKLHKWTDKGETRWGALLGEKGMVFASGEEELKAALDLIDGKGESLADRMPEDRKLPPGTIAGAFVRDLNEAKNVPPQMALVKQIKSHMFLVGEHEGEAFYIGRTTMTNEEVVGQVQDMLKGLRAFALVQAGEDEASQEVVKAFEMNAEGDHLTVRARGSVEVLWKALEAQAKRMEQLRKEARSKK